MKTFCLLIILLTFLNTFLLAQIYPLDSTFGDSGKTIVDITSVNIAQNHIATQIDGKIVLATSKVKYNSGYDYDFCHVRFNADGSPDNSFGSQGMILCDLGSTEDFAFDVIIQSDDKILVVGTSGEFTDRDFAVVRLNADGENRHTTASTGLCYKCNDFSNNAYDIDIVRDDLVPLTSTYGINRNQGITSSNNPSTNKDTLAASNTFSTTPYQYNIHNTNNPSNYYFQESKVPAYAKIMPNPVLGINRYQNNSTTYNKPLVCKSWINSGGGIGQELAAKSLASSNAETADLQLINTVDGGSTTNLTFDITGSTPPEALTLREELLQKSPYLSDTVMKSATGQENVLPNAMVRDILTENPQAAKSEEIMSMLDNRWEPMPDYMKEEIETGKTIIGGREQLEAIRDGWLQQESFLTNRIISTYLGDTVNPNAINELKAFLQNENTIQSGFVLADICLQRGDYGVSNQAINTIQTNFTLSQFESQQAADYLALNTILAGLHADTIELSSVDSVRAIPLFTQYQSGENNATAFARDILIASGLLSYQEPINLGNNEKAAIAQLPNIKSANTVKNSSEQLSIFPNPATTYTIIEYTLPANSSNSSVSIYNTHGVVVWQQEIKRAKDQVIIDLSNYTSGSYIVSLQLGNQTVASKSLSVTK